MNETRCLSTGELLTEAWEYFTEAKQNGDMAGECRWLEAVDFLLDKMNGEKAA